MTRVQAPSGEIIEFPDGMKDDDIAAVMRKEFGGPEKTAPPDPVKPALQKAERGTFLDPLVGQGLLMGAGDEIKSAVRAGVKAPFSDETFGQIYDKELKGTRADLESYRERHPVLSPAAEVGGAIAGVVGTGGASLVPRMGTAAAKVGMAAAEGAGVGGLYGFNAGEGGLENRAKSAAVGGGVGALTGGVAGSIGGRMASKAVNKAIPTTDDLRATSQKLYDIADKAKVVVRPQAYDKMVNTIALKARSAGMDHGVHPKAGAAVTRLLDEVGQPKTLQEMEILRRVLGSAAKSTEPDERRVASIMIDAMDDQMDNLKASDISSGNLKVGVGALQGARELWKRQAKGEVVEDIFERAGVRSGQFSQSGMENALRTEFRQLAMNKKRLRGFTAEEQAAIRKVATGGPVENTLRLLGKFAPRGIVSSTLGGGAGYAVGGPVGAAAVMGAGELGKRAAQNMAITNAERVGQLARSGGQIPRVQLTAEQARTLAALKASGAPIPANLEALLEPK